MGNSWGMEKILLLKFLIKGRIILTFIVSQGGTGPWCLSAFPLSLFVLGIKARNISRQKIY